MSTEQGDKGHRMKRRMLLAIIVLAAVAACISVIWPRASGPPRTEPVASIPSSTTPGQRELPARSPSVFDPAASADVPPVRDPVVEGADVDFVAAKISIPKHKWQAERVSNIRRESISDCIASLGNFDDQHLAETSISGIRAGSTVGQSIVVTRLARVRRLLEEGHRSPDSVVGTFRSAFKTGLDEWPEARQEFITAFEQSEAKGVAFTQSEPMAYDKLKSRSLAATYVLAELEDHESLPLMIRSFEMNIDPKRMTSPAPPAITFYAMHRLMLSYPEGELTSELRHVREEYLAAVDGILPEPRTETVTKWHADYSESDPRVVLFDPKKQVLRDQPRMEMRIYPVRFVDGESFTRSMGRPSERTMKLFLKIKRFVQLAFPESGS